jgi:hypothetical protein
MERYHVHNSNYEHWIEDEGTHFTGYIRDKRTGQIVDQTGGGTSVLAVRNEALLSIAILEEEDAKKMVKGYPVPDGTPTPNVTLPPFETDIPNPNVPWEIHAIHDEFRDLQELFDRKEKDYADAVPLRNIRAARKLGCPAWYGVILRMADKWARLEVLTERLVTTGEGPAVEDEPIEKTLEDIANYAVIALVMLRETDQDPILKSTRRSENGRL